MYDVVCLARARGNGLRYIVLKQMRCFHNGRDYNVFFGTRMQWETIDRWDLVRFVGLTHVFMKNLIKAKLCTFN